MDLQKAYSGILTQGGQLLSNIGKGVSSVVQNFSHPITAQGIGNTTPINYGQVAQQAATNVGNYFNPTMVGSAGNPRANFWTTPVAQALGNVQQYIESPTHTQIVPTIQPFRGNNFGSSLLNGIANMPGGIVNTIVGQGVIDPSLDIGQNIGRTIAGREPLQYNQAKSPLTRLGYQLAGVINPESKLDYGTQTNVPQVVGNAAESLIPIVTAYTGGKAKAVINPESEQIATKLAQPIWKSIVKGATSGGKYGTAFGALQGFADSRNITNPFDYALNVLKNTAMGTVTGTVAGATINPALEFIGAVKGAIKKDDPSLTPQQVNKKTFVYIRDGAGRFAGIQDIKNAFTPAGKTHPTVAGDIPIKRGGETVGWMDRIDKSVGVDKNARPTIGLAIKTLSKEQHDANVASANPEVVPQGGQRQSSFSNITAPQSNNVGETLSTTLKDKNVTYTPQTEQAGLQAASKYAANGIKNKTIEVQNTLSKPVGTITRQEALNAQAVALKLQDSLGNIPVDKMTPAQKQTLDTATNILTKLSEHYTASGQLSQSAAVLRSQTPQGLYYSAIKTLGNIKDNNGASILDKNPQLQTTLSNLVNDVKGTKVGTPAREMAVQKLVQTVTDQIPRSLGDKAFGIWRAMLISGPETATKVATSYGINLPGQLISRPISAVADTVIAHTPGVGFLQRNNPNYTAGERSITFNPSDYGAFGKGAVKGTKAIPLKLKTNLDVPGTSSFNGYDNPAQSMTRSSQQTIIEKPFTRLHASIPKPVYTGTYDMNIAEQARTAAVNAGKAGDQKFIQNLIQNPTTQMKEIARTEAEKATNMATNKATQASSAVQNMPWIGRILNPIAKVPANIGVQGLVDYSPLGYGKALGQVIHGIAKGTFDQRDFSTAVGKATVGTGIAALGAALMNAGRMSLAQPTDQKERALNEAQNIPNNSVYVGGTVTKDSNGVWQRNGGTWISLNAAGPAGITLGLGGGTAKGGPVAGIAAGGKLLADQPYVQGIAGFGQALSDPTRYANTFLDRTASSIIPGAVAQPAAGTDTVQRMPAKNIQDALTSKIPLARETLAPQRNIYGQTLPGANPQGTVLGGILGSINPLYPQASMNTNDPVISEIQRLYNANGSAGAPAISQPTANQTIQGQKVKLNSQQLSNYIAQTGPKIQQNLSNLIQQPDYQNLSDENKVKAINSVLDSVKKQVKGTADLSSPQAPTQSSNTSTGVTNGVGGKYTIINPDTGSVKTIDLSQPVDQPQLTGNTELDKQLVSKYNSALTTRANDIVTLYKNGKIDAATAEKALGEIKQQKTATAKPKKVSVKAPKIPKLHLVAPRAAKVKAPRASAYTLKAPKLNIAPIPRFGSSLPKARKVRLSA